MFRLRLPRCLASRGREGDHRHALAGSCIMPKKIAPALAYKNLSSKGQAKIPKWGDSKSFYNSWLQRLEGPHLRRCLVCKVSQTLRWVRCIIFSHLRVILLFLFFSAAVMLREAIEQRCSCSSVLDSVRPADLQCVKPPTFFPRLSSRTERANGVASWLRGSRAGAQRTTPPRLGGWVGEAAGLRWREARRQDPTSGRIPPGHIPAQFQTPQEALQIASWQGQEGRPLLAIAGCERLQRLDRGQYPDRGSRWRISQGLMPLPTYSGAEVHLHEAQTAPTRYSLGTPSYAPAHHQVSPLNLWCMGDQRAWRSTDLVPMFLRMLRRLSGLHRSSMLLAWPGQDGEPRLGYDA